MTVRPSARRVLAVLGATVALTAACSAGDTTPDVASPTDPSVTSTTLADPAVPTLPAGALDDVDDGAVGDPDPALPVDMVPVAFAVGALASLGDVQFVVESAAAVTEEGSDVTITARFRNASLSPVQFSPDAFRLYAASGQSFTVADPVDGFFSAPLGADQWAPVVLQFRVAAGQRPVMLVFDGAAYGDRVFSGAVAIDV
jgi:hypothetical protein